MNGELMTHSLIIMVKEKPEFRLLLFGIFILFTHTPYSSAVVDNNAEDKKVKVPKCCEINELIVNNRCTHKNETNSSTWKPVFTNEFTGKSNEQVPQGFKFVVGFPQCGPRQQWPIYHYEDSMDKLVLLLPSVRLRHIISREEGKLVPHTKNVLEQYEDDRGDTHHHYDYERGTYCLDKVLLTNKDNKMSEAQYAMVCVPEIESDWDSTDYVMRRIVDPVCHGLAIACYLVIAVVYFVIPQLKDLVGNILTSISLCLITSQAADVVKIFTEFSNHVSFLIADIIMYVSILAAFFWLNSLGYYIWKTFRSRNVFLRVTDGRKYCYYSCYAWSFTFGLAALALFAHFMLEVPSQKGKPTQLIQDNIGWLGTAVFFTPIAFTILVNIFFYLTTGHAINQMSTYGRIHHKMKYSFELFVKLFLVMAIAWLFLLLSWLRYDALVYCNIIVNILQAILILYICVLGQRRVTFLLKQSCCCQSCPFQCCQPAEPVDTAEWGEEMSSVTAH